MILCVTPSPAVDRTARVERFTPDRVLRPADLSVLPGGKGVNVARVANALGALVATTGYAGGHAGRWLVEALAAEGLNPRFVETALETRTTYVLIDGARHSLLLYEPAAPVTEADVANLMDLLRDELLPAAEFVVIAGSFPPPRDPEVAAALVGLCRQAGRPCLVDTTGTDLMAALGARPDTIKISLEEAEASGIVVRGGRASAREAAAELCRRGASRAIVTDGPRGAAACDATGIWEVGVPQVRALSPVGSGDAFSAGLAVGLAGGRSFAESLAMGAAAGTANTQSIGAGQFHLRDYEAALASVRVRRAGSPTRRSHGSD